MNTIDFLINLRRAVSIFTSDMTSFEDKTFTDRKDDILKYELGLMYYSIIEYYFRDTEISGDQNIMEEAELQVVIDKLNNIMNTYLNTDFS